jgi:hypothetical protein
MEENCCRLALQWLEIGGPHGKKKFPMASIGFAWKKGK